MDDLATRLRNVMRGDDPVLDEAADRIEALEAALRKLAETDLTGIAIAALGEKADGQDR